MAPCVRLSSAAARVKLPCWAAAAKDVNPPIDGISPRFNADKLRVQEQKAAVTILSCKIDAIHCFDGGILHL
jgi:hypothetical protein